VGGGGLWARPSMDFRSSCACAISPCAAARLNVGRLDAGCSACALRETCPVSTEGGTRRVQLVREEGRDVSSHLPSHTQARA
jgi:hypothetical protein